MKIFRTLVVPMLIAGIAMSVTAIGALAAAGPLVVTKSANTTAVAPGGTLTYTITVRNSGDAQADNVVLNETLNGNYEFVSSGTFTPSMTSGANGTTNLQYNLGSIAAGSTITVPITVRASSGITVDSTINNSVSVTSSNAGSATSNTISVSVGPTSPSIIISKVPTGPVVTAGGIITYSITVRNVGGSAATGVVVTDIMDPATTFLSSNPTPATNAGGTFSFNVGTLDEQESFTFNSQVQVNANAPVGTVIDNTVRVTGTNFAPVQAPSAVTVNAAVATAIPTPSAATTPTPTPSPTSGAVIFDPIDGDLPRTGLGTALVLILAALLVLTLWPLFSSRKTEIRNE